MKTQSSQYAKHNPSE